MFLSIRKKESHVESHVPDGLDLEKLDVTFSSAHNKSYHSYNFI